MLLKFSEGNKIVFNKRAGYAVAVVLIAGSALFFYSKSRISPAEDAYRRGESLVSVGMKDEAGDLFLEAARLNPKYAPPYRSLALLASNIKAYPLAVKYWQKFVELDKTAKEAYSQLAYAQLMTGQEVPAYKSAEEELKRNPGSPQAHLTLGVLNARRSSPKLALEHLEIASQAEVYKDVPKVHLVYAKVLALTGNFDRAEQILTAVIAKDKSYAEPYYWLGYIYARKIETPANLKEAEKHLHASLDLQPLFPQANLEMGKLYLREKKLDLALTYINRALQNRKHYPAALFVQAKVLDGLGRKAEAQKAQDELRVESQKAERLKTLLRQYSAKPDDLETELALINAQLDLEQPQAAGIFLQDGMTRAPKDQRFQDAMKRAEAMMKQQNNAGARQDMQLSISEDMDEKQ